MSHIPINIATEDELSETTLKHLLAHVNRGYEIGTAYRRGGYGYLKRTINGWNQAARGTPVIVLTDLDTAACPVQLLESWLADPLHPNLLFRVAVREVESWLLADLENLLQYLQVKRTSSPADPDALPDPKLALIDLARMSRSSELKSRMIPKSGSTAKQGPDYNACLSTFVKTKWDINSAKANSLSLRRTAQRLSTFTPCW